MKCLYCEGELKKTETVFHVDREGIHLTIDKLAVYKCEVCGEIMLDTPEVKLIQKVLNQLENTLKRQVA